MRRHQARGAGWFVDTFRLRGGRRGGFALARGWRSRDGTGDHDARLDHFNVKFVKVIRGNGQQPAVGAEASACQHRLRRRDGGKQGFSQGKFAHDYSSSSSARVGQQAPVGGNVEKQPHVVSQNRRGCRLQFMGLQPLIGADCDEEPARGIKPGANDARGVHHRCQLRAAFRVPHHGLVVETGAHHALPRKIKRCMHHFTLVAHQGARRMTGCRGVNFHGAVAPGRDDVSTIRAELGRSHVDPRAFQRVMPQFREEPAPIEWIKFRVARREAAGARQCHQRAAEISLVFCAPGEGHDLLNLLPLEARRLAPRLFFGLLRAFLVAHGICLFQQRQAPLPRLFAPCRVHQQRGTRCDNRHQRQGCRPRGHPASVAPREPP